MDNLNEGKRGKPNYMAELAEIDTQSAIVAMEAKINKLEEMAKAKETRLEMVSEDENLSELISKSAVKEMQKEIKEIRKMQEKLKKVYEKKNGKKPVEVVDEEEKVDEMQDPNTGVVGDDSMIHDYLDEDNTLSEVNKSEMIDNLATIAPDGDTGGKLVGKEKELLQMFQNMDSDELEQYEKVAAQEPDEITQANYFEFLDSLKNKTKKVSEEVNRWQKLAGL